MSEQQLLLELDYLEQPEPVRVWTDVIYRPYALTQYLASLSSGLENQERQQSEQD